MLHQNYAILSDLFVFIFVFEGNLNGKSSYVKNENLRKDTFISLYSFGLANEAWQNSFETFQGYHRKFKTFLQEKSYSISK